MVVQRSTLEMSDEPSIREDGTKSTRVSSLDDDVWEKELAKELVFPDGLSVSMEELAMHCL